MFMTNRDALLSAARKCLLDKGYNRTTARDIASAAGVSLAAIGYHFSSKETLLTEALLLAFGEWDQDLQKALQTAVPSHVSPAERFEATWTKIIVHRPLWVTKFRNLCADGGPASRPRTLLRARFMLRALASQPCSSIRTKVR